MKIFITSVFFTLITTLISAQPINHDYLENKTINSPGRSAKIENLDFKVDKDKNLYQLFGSRFDFLLGKDRYNANYTNSGDNTFTYYMVKYDSLHQKIWSTEFVVRGGNGSSSGERSVLSMNEYTGEIYLTFNGISSIITNYADTICEKDPKKKKHTLYSSLVRVNSENGKIVWHKSFGYNYPLAMGTSVVQTQNRKLYMSMTYPDSIFSDKDTIPFTRVTRNDDFVLFNMLLIEMDNKGKILKHISMVNTDTTPTIFNLSSATLFAEKNDIYFYSRYEGKVSFNGTLLNSEDGFRTSLIKLDTNFNLKWKLTSNLADYYVSGLKINESIYLVGFIASTLLLDGNIITKSVNNSLSSFVTSIDKQTGKIKHIKVLNEPSLLIMVDYARLGNKHYVLCQNQDSLRQPISTGMPSIPMGLNILETDSTLLNYTLYDTIPLISQNTFNLYSSPFRHLDSYNGEMYVAAGINYPFYGCEKYKREGQRDNLGLIRNPGDTLHWTCEVNGPSKSHNFIARFTKNKPIEINDVSYNYVQAITLYPNPSSTGIYNLSDDITGTESIPYIASNTLGQIVNTGQVQYGQIDLGFLPNGLYAIQLYQGKTIYTAKVAKME